MGAIGAFLRALRYGSELANVEAWKAGLIRSGAVVGFLSALVAFARLFGFEIPVTDAQLGDIATGVLAVGSVIVSLLTAATSKRAGLPGLASAADVAGVATRAAATAAAESAAATEGHPARDDPQALPPGDQAAAARRTDPFRPGT